MNLLNDAWIPVLTQGRRKLICLQDVLCCNENWPLALSRDDMELACLQLMICLTQVIFPPEDERALKQRILKPLTEEEYAREIVPFVDWFDLNHPETPFMQIRGVKVEKHTPIQKLFVGLPEGNNHAFFNDTGELKKVCSSCTAIALFNQNSNAPGFSGKQKSGIRGSTPITTLVSLNSLRTTIWTNVLHMRSLENLRLLKPNDTPVWAHPIVPIAQIEQYIKKTKPKNNKKLRKNIPGYEIGLFRGLFWLPVLIELTDENGSENQRCDLCGLPSNIMYDGFYLGSDFYFEISGNWPHPHSPHFWNLRQGKKEEKYLSFTTTAPAWTQLSRFVVESESENEGQQPAFVVTQFRGMSRGAPMQLLVGGYRNKQASILQRRHELLPLSAGWDNHLDGLKQTIQYPLDIKKSLVQSTCLFGIIAGAAKRNRKKNRSITPDGLKLYKNSLDKYPFSNFEEFFDGIHQKAEALFYHNSEHLIHACFRRMDWEEAARTRRELRDQLIHLSWKIFEEVTQPYRHEPKMIKALAIARKTLSKAFKKLRGET